LRNLRILEVFMDFARIRGFWGDLRILWNFTISEELEDFGGI